ncbi:MAG TPA: sugar phosphate isomerase/epimerase family protein [Pirellulales bacterium]|nr:sugar phosphate isomerase/epimerase family protein [Pirellulales bacterium]
MKISYLNCEPVARLTELAARMDLLASLGYQGIELTARHPADYPAEDVLALCEKLRLPVVSVLSGWSYSNEGLCLCSSKAEVRARAVERLIEYVDFASRLKAVLVVGLMQGLRSDEPNEAVAAERITHCLRQVAEAAAQRNATVVIEPVNHLQVGFHHTADEVAEIVRQIGSPGLSYMLDTIHMNIEERSILDTIRAHGRHIRHFHLCESSGGPFGSGNLDFPAVLDELEKSGYDRFVSVKIYRKLAWDEAARNTARFLELGSI